MPLFDQDGVQRDEAEVVFFESVPIERVLVRHDEILFFVDDGEAAFTVGRPTHPGAGLALDMADWVERDA